MDQRGVNTVSLFFLPSLFRWRQHQHYRDLVALLELLNLIRIRVTVRRGHVCIPLFILTRLQLIGQPTQLSSYTVLHHSLPLDAASRCTMFALFNICRILPTAVARCPEHLEEGVMTAHATRVPRVFPEYRNRARL